MDKANYFTQRLAALGADTDLQRRVEALEAENAKLREQQGAFKSEAQVRFEQSPEFEQLLNAYYLRFLRSRFSAEFHASPFIAELQETANRMFAEFEKPKEVTPNAQAGKKDSGASKTNPGKDA